MRSALICPGPSASTFPGRSGYELVIAVNRGSLLVTPDYQASIDLDFLLSYAPTRPAPNLLTNAATLADLRRRGHFWGDRNVVTTDELRGYCCPVKDAPGWTLYSATAALVLAGWLGATEVECYGVDWLTDAGDWDGVPAGGDRSAGRFKCEAAVWEGVAGWLARMGVKVRRVQSVPADSRSPTPVGQ